MIDRIGGKGTGFFDLTPQKPRVPANAAAEPTTGGDRGQLPTEGCKT